MTQTESLSHLLAEKKEQSSREKTGYTPHFFYAGLDKDREQLQELLRQHAYIKVHDEIDSQLRELIKSRHPAKKLQEQEISGLIREHIGDMPLHEYGVWVYYPWHGKLVHILDREEFVELRTNRNLYKITGEERELLSTKKIGIIGLSVGQSVALTLSMERGYGELRIADMDELEITNLNRLRGGVYNFGIKKTVLVAREIAEIDPYLKVTCFHEGVTEENIESFLISDGKIDVLIDECDGLDIKILCRVKAKEFGIPVLMEASDRATVDVERFDLEPERSILHGFIDHLDISKVKYLKTSEEKVPYILPIAGVETLSSRMKASMIEVGETISTWPQLASAVSLGGGITADVCRRILLDQFHQSGRYFVDIEELIGDKKEVNIIPQTAVADLTLEIIKNHINKINLHLEEGQIKPSEENIQEIVKAGSAAPSAGNNQPWKWYFDSFNLWLFHDLKRSHSYGDFRNIASYVALGAAIENAELKANELNINLKTDIFPYSDNKENPVAVMRIYKNNEPASIKKDQLSAYIYQRHTNRKSGSGAKIPDEIFKELNDSVKKIPGATFHYTEAEKDIARLANVLGTAERLRIFIPEGHYDLFEKELRWTNEEARITGDGIDLETFEVSPTEYIGLRLARSPETIQLLKDWNSGKALEKLTRKGINSSSAIGLITMPAFSPDNFVLGGKAVERMWLSANRNNISVQPMLAALLHFARLHEGQGKERMPLKIKENFEDLYREYSDIWGNDRKNKTDIFLFRLGITEAPAIKSYRLNLNQVYFSKG